MSVLLAAAPFGSARAADPPTLSAVRLDEGRPTPVIDGAVTDEAWNGAAPYDVFTQQDPTEGAPASERTEVRVLFDRTTLYVGIVCFDREPDKIIVSQARRERTERDKRLPLAREGFHVAHRLEEALNQVHAEREPDARPFPERLGGHP